MEDKIASKTKSEEKISKILEQIKESAPSPDQYDRDTVRETAEKLSQEYVKAVRAGA